MKRLRDVGFIYAFVTIFMRFPLDQRNLDRFGM